MPNGCCILLSEKKEAILTVLPGYECWHCQEPGTGWGCGSEMEARKIYFSFQGMERKDWATLLGLAMISRPFWPPSLKRFCPFFCLQGETSKSLEKKKWKIDQDPSKCRRDGMVGLLEKWNSPVNPLPGLLVWHLGLGAEQWEGGKSTLSINELSANP